MKRPAEGQLVYEYTGPIEQMRKLSFLSGVYPVFRRPRRGHGARRARHRRVRLAVAPPSTAPLHVL